MTVQGSAPDRWDLSELYRGPGDVAIAGDMSDIEEQVRALVRMAETSVRLRRLHEPTALFAVLSLLADLQTNIFYAEPRADEQFMGSKPEYYAALLRSMHPDDAAIIEFEERIRAWANSLRMELAAVLRSIGAIDPVYQPALLASKELAEYRDWLSRRFAGGQHDLDEAGQHWAQIDATVIDQAREKLAGFLRSKLVPLRLPSGIIGVTYRDLNPYLYSDDPATRRAAEGALGEILGYAAEVGLGVFETVVSGRQVAAERRHFDSVLEAACFDEGLDPEIVTLMLEVAGQHFPSVHYFYLLRALFFAEGDRETLPYAQRARPVQAGDGEARYTWDDAVELIMGVWRQANPVFAAMFQTALAKGRIFASGRGVARCWRSVGDLPPYLELNFHGTLRDVLVLAHEVGHYFGALLMAERRDGLSNNPPRSQDEIASMVVEQVVAALLQPEAGLSDQERLTLLMGRMDLVAGSFFRQAAGSLYERALYEMRAEEGGLSILGLNQLFLEHIGAYLGRAVVFDDGAEMSWALWPHLLSGFSNLAYVLAAPVAGELRRRVTADPSYIEKIVTLMAAGSGRSLKELLLTEYNIDLSSADFWRRAIEEWDETIEELSELMDRLGYLRR